MDDGLTSRDHDVVIVGAGAAGVGVAVALQHAGVDDVVLLDRNTVGASFDAWPAETRFITPSFPTNSIGMLDLNAVALGTSPAVSLRAEHPTGAQFAAYLRLLANFFELTVFESVEVGGIRRVGGMFLIDVDDEAVRAKHVIWAAGEFNYPRVDGFAGVEHCRHTATIERYEDLPGHERIVIGGYESGIDAAYHLASTGRRVRLMDSGCPWQSNSSDPSVALSTYSIERMAEPRFIDRVQLFPNKAVASVRRVGNGFTVSTVDGAEFETMSPPLFAGGFEGSHTLVADLFESRNDGFPLMSDDDESTITPGLFLCGPAVRHGNQSFCFIYKYRQRFAVVAKAIATSLGLPAEELEVYRMWGMYLDDLSTCGQECVC